MPPKKTINRPEVRDVSWENLRGPHEHNMFVGFSRPPDVDTTESIYDLFTTRPKLDENLEKSEYYRQWLGARIEQGRLDNTDLTYFFNELNRYSPETRAIFLLPKDTQMDKIVSGSVAVAVENLIAVVGTDAVADQCDRLDLWIGTEEPSGPSPKELAALLAPITKNIYVQRWGQYFAVILEITGGAHMYDWFI